MTGTETEKPLTGPSLCRCGHLRIEHRSGRNCARAACGCSLHRSLTDPNPIAEVERLRAALVLLAEPAAGRSMMGVRRIAREALAGGR